MLGFEPWESINQTTAASNGDNKICASSPKVTCKKSELLVSIFFVSGISISGMSPSFEAALARK
jgi:hypothetical protein